ncbi:MAG TPA: hypothetical protein VK395_08810 [Gemmataceae bacterium]|nr:hypothetical protein [Gemmataceae bacterium]
MILTFGIISLFCFPPVFGPMAWVMGNNDLREMRAGRMDREGEQTTNAGRICGIIGSILFLVGCAFYAVIIGFGVLAAGIKK